MRWVNSSILATFTQRVWASPLTKVCATALRTQQCDWKAQQNNVRFLPGTATYVTWRGSRLVWTVFCYGLGFLSCGRNTMCLVWPGRERVQRKGKKRTQRRLDCTIITFLLSIWRTLKSESTIPSQYLYQGNHCSHHLWCIYISSGSY